MGYQFSQKSGNKNTQSKSTTAKMTTTGNGGGLGNNVNQKTTKMSKSWPSIKKAQNVEYKKTSKKGSTTDSSKTDKKKEETKSNIGKKIGSEFKPGAGLSKAFGNVAENFKKTKEEMFETIDKKRIADMNNPAITNDWLRVYDRPTVAGEGRSVAKHPDAKKFDWGMPEENSGVFASESAAAKIINKEHQMAVNQESNNTYTDDDGRYWVAIGPNFMNPNRTSNDKGKGVMDTEMQFGTKLDIHVVGEDGKDYYIPAVVGDGKEHSYPDGLYQTGVPFSNERNVYEGDGSTVEFIGHNITEYLNENGESKSTINYTNDYELLDLIIYDGELNYK